MGCCGGGFGGFFGQRQPQHQLQQTPEKQNAPLNLLKERLARGEITMDEYKKLAEVLEETVNAR